MFACVCYAVGEQQVTAAVADGADSVEEVGESTGAGTGCGICHERLQGLIDRQLTACPRLKLAV